MRREVGIDFVTGLVTIVFFAANVLIIYGLYKLTAMINLRLVDIHLVLVGIIAILFSAIITYGIGHIVNKNFEASGIKIYR